MVLLNSLDDRTDHDVRFDKLRYKVDDFKLNPKMRHLFFMEILYKMRFVAKLKKKRQICSNFGSQRVPRVLAKKTSNHNLCFLS